MSDNKALSLTSLSSEDYNIADASFESEKECISVSSDSQEEVLKENATQTGDDRYSLTEAIKDIEEKLSDKLKENVKLKDILKRKDDAIRKQFNTIVLLEREVIKICENYKNSFFEVKNLVNQLKQENKKLHVIIKSNDLQNSLTDSNSSSEVNSFISNSEVKTIDESITMSTASGFELGSAKDVKDLLQKIGKMATSHAQLQSRLEEVEKQREADLEQFNKQLEINQKELEILKQKLILPEKSKLLRLINEDYKKELERKYLVEVIKLLEQKMQISSTNRGTQIRKHGHESNLQDKRWHEFIECFIEQCVQNADLKKFQAECKNVVQTFKNTQLSSGDIFNDNVTHAKNNAICDYRKILIDEQLQCIKDERTTLNVQRQFLKVLADYDKVVVQLEMLKNENSRLIEIQKAECNANNFAEIEKCLLEEKKNFDVEQEKMSEERSNIEKKKQLIRDEWELLSAERTILLEEKDELIAESKRLQLQDSLLQQKIATFNNKKSEPTNEDVLNEKLRQTTAELDGVKEELQYMHGTITNLREELSKLINQESEITAYKLQAEMQEAEFLDMREAERNFLQQIENLTTEIHQLREENHQLVNRDENECENENQV